MLRLLGMVVSSWICVLALSAPALAACEIDGDCQPGQMCQEGECVCKPDCKDKDCGPDTCGGVCGTGDKTTMGCPPEKPNCNSMSFICEGDCTPDCSGKECGSDGCGGNCGMCPCDTCDAEAVECAGGTCKIPYECDCVCIFDCFELCPEGDQACLQNCVTSATIEGQATYTNLNACLLEAGYYDCPADDDACLDTTAKECADEYFECFAGEANCLDTYLCIISCPAGADSEACVQACFDAGSKEALLTWSTFIDCLDANGYYDCETSDANCKNQASAACEAEFLDCAHGESACDDVLLCMQACEVGDDLCSAACRANGTVAAQKSLQALYNCVDVECGNSTDADCEQFALDDACSDALKDCLGDTCLPQCKDKACGDDGCGGTCGECDGDTVCQQGECVDGSVVADGGDADVVTQPSDTSGNTFNPVIEDDASAGESSSCSQSGGTATPALLLLFFLLAAIVSRRSYN